VLATTPSIVIPITAVAWFLHVVEALVALLFYLWKGKEGVAHGGVPYLLRLGSWLALVVMLGGGALQPLIRESTKIQAQLRQQTTTTTTAAKSPKKPKQT